MTRRATIRVMGIVQGVFFRHSAKLKADELQLAGWVRNLPDGSVEVVSEGNENEILQLIAWCRRGPDGAYVKGLEVQWEEATGSRGGFSIVH